MLVTTRKWKLPSKILIRLFILLFCSTLIFCSNKQTINPGTFPSSKTKLEVLPAEIANVSTPADALTALQEGFSRYKNGQFKHIHIKRVIDQQDEEPDPFVAIISCSDFNIPPEILFDLDKNNILLLKTSANTDDAELISQMKQAVKSKKIKLILVLGHSQCRAIGNVIYNRPNTEASIIKLHVSEAIPANRSDTSHLVETTAKNNISFTIKRIATKYPSLDSLLKPTDIEVKGAFYDAKSASMVYNDSF